MTNTKKDKLEVEGGITQTPDIVAKQAARQATAQSVPPPSFIAESIAEAKEKPAPKPQDDEIIAEGAKSDFWRIIKRFIDDRSQKLRENTGASIASGNLTLEQIGLKSLWKDLVVDTYQDLVDFVENRAKLVEVLRREEQEKKADEANKRSKS